MCILFCNLLLYRKESSIFLFICQSIVCICFQGGGLSVVQVPFLLSYHYHWVYLYRQIDIQTLALWYRPDSSPKSFGPCIMRFVSIRVNKYLYYLLALREFNTFSINGQICLVLVIYFHYIAIGLEPFNPTAMNFKILVEGCMASWTS